MSDPSNPTEAQTTRSTAIISTALVPEKMTMCRRMADLSQLGAPAEDHDCRDTQLVSPLSNKDVINDLDDAVAAKQVSLDDLRRLSLIAVPSTKPTCSRSQGVSPVIAALNDQLIAIPCSHSHSVLPTYFARQVPAIGYLSIHHSRAAHRIDILGWLRAEDVGSKTHGDLVDRSIGWCGNCGRAGTLHEICDSCSAQSSDKGTELGLLRHHCHAVLRLSGTCASRKSNCTAIRLELRIMI